MSRPLTKKQQHWTEILKSADSSELSLTDYARINHIDVKELYRWRNQLKNLSQPAGDTKTKFKKVVAANLTGTPCLSIKLHHAQLQFNVLPDPEWLAKLLAQQSLPA